MRKPVLVLAPSLLLSATVAARPQAAQTSASFTGKWEGIATFTGTIVQGHLTGEIAGELDGVAGPRGTVDAAPVK